MPEIIGLLMHLSENFPMPSLSSSVKWIMGELKLAKQIAEKQNLSTQE